MSKLIITAIFLFSIVGLSAQELNMNAKVNSQKLLSADQKIFATLEQSVREFMISQKWTEDIYENDERINCNLLLTLTDQSTTNQNLFVGELSIQASRPVYGTDYETVIFNHIDKSITFTYEQYQPLVFSKNAYNDNLSSILSFYAYIILGMDADSFSPFGGDKYFQNAQDIISNLPSGVSGSDSGWKTTVDKNRFRMMENILSARVRPYRQAMYDYHRQALDVMALDVAKGRQTLVDALQKVSDVNQAYPNTLIIQMFTNTKAQEIIEIFKRGSLQEQDRVIQIMSRVDPSNSSNYRGIK